ncbi:MAG: hypothetical protein RBT64_12875, partial [Trichloromonas sp.]|nr:hypothetical protein [Trichloromonas sp.]
LLYAAGPAACGGRDPLRPSVVCAGPGCPGASSTAVSGRPRRRSPAACAVRSWRPWSGLV